MKTCSFGLLPYEGWPSPAEMKKYFLGPGPRYFYEGRNDHWGFGYTGAFDTEHLPLGKGRINIQLYMYGHPELGVLLHHTVKGGGRAEVFTSKGDLSPLRQWVRTLQEDLMPVGLFVPFETAWLAVEDFLDNDGARSNRIEWVDNRTLPENTFPVPHEKIDPAAMYRSKLDRDTLYAGRV